MSLIAWLVISALGVALLLALGYIIGDRVSPDGTIYIHEGNQTIWQVEFAVPPEKISKRKSARFRLTHLHPERTP